MRVTVYILNFNQWDYLNQAIQSVFEQTYKNIEVILVDNKSAHADRFLQDFSQKFKFDRVLARADSNLKRAANEVLSVCTGDYILRLDADDFLNEFAIQSMIDKATSEKADFVSTDYYLIDQEGNALGQYYKNSDIDFAKRPDIPMHGACCLISTDFLKSNDAYNIDIIMQDGYDIWLAMNGEATGAHINLPLFSYRRHNKNISNDSDKVIAARRSILASHCPDIPRYALCFFTRLPSSQVLENIQPFLSELGKAYDVTPTEIIIFAAGTTDSMRSVDLPNLEITLVERNDPSALAKNAIQRCLTNFKSDKSDSYEYFVCVYQNTVVDFSIISGALRTAECFESDIVHSVRRETMNLYYHDGVGLKALSENQNFTDERSIIFKRYPICDIYRSEKLNETITPLKIGHFLLKSNETVLEANNEWEFS